jgi:hypothetical protein
MAMAFVNSYSFSHRFSDDAAPVGYSSYQEIIHQSNADSAATLTREFYCFALACGFAPQSVVGSFIDLAEEYGQAHCDLRGNLVWQDAVAWRETGRDNGTSSTQQPAV